jgi:hypothetical protein
MRAAWTIEISCQMEWSLVSALHLLELGKMPDILTYWTTHCISITIINVFLSSIALWTKCILVPCTPSKLVATTVSLYNHPTIGGEHLLFPINLPPSRTRSNDFLQVWQISEGGRLLSLPNI